MRAKIGARTGEFGEFGDREQLAMEKLSQRASCSSLIALCPQIPSTSPELLSEGEGEQGRAGGDGDVLLAVYRIAHWTAIDLASQRDLPKQFSVASVEREEVAFAS